MNTIKRYQCRHIFTEDLREPFEEEEESGAPRLDSETWVPSQAQNNWEAELAGRDIARMKNMLHVPTIFRGELWINRLAFGHQTHAVRLFPR